jgi:hypothetical protein
MTPMVQTETVEKVIKEVITEKKNVLDKDFAKELAIMLLEGKAEVVSYTKCRDTNEFIYEGWKVVDFGGTVTEEVKLQLPKGIKVTIERESY